MAPIFVIVAICLILLLVVVYLLADRSPPKVVALHGPSSPAVTEVPKPVSAEVLWQRRRAWLEGRLYEPKGARAAPITQADTCALDLTDEKFETILTESFEGIRPNGFYITLAGVSHLNDDGTRRDVIVAMCREFDPLDLTHDTDSAFSKHAVSVTRKEDGLQLGFLPDRTAGEVVRDIKHGTKYAALFRHANFHPTTERVVGCVVFVLRWDEEVESG